MTVDLKAALATVEAAVKAAEAEQASIGPRVDGDREWWTRHRAAMERCAEDLTASVGARINDRWDGCRVRIAGVSSTCTAGMAGALRNWTVAARRKLEATSA